MVKVKQEDVMLEIQRVEKNPIIVELAKRFIEEIRNKGNGNKIYFVEATAPALVYIAYRKAKIPKILDEISEMDWNLPQQKRKRGNGRDYELMDRKAMVGREYKRIKRLLGMKLCGEEASLISTNCLLQTTPEAVMERFANALTLSEKSKEKARKLLKKYEKECFGMKPSIIAGTMLLIAGTLSQEKRTQREVADVVDATEVSIRNGLYRILKNHPNMAEVFKDKSSKQKRHRHKSPDIQEDVVTLPENTETKDL